MSSLLSRAGFAVACLLLTLGTARAGVTNPDISVIGQMRTFLTNDPADSNRNRAQFSFDESELVFDAALNPYAHGTFVFAVADGGVEVEEGYLNIVRGLPDGFALKAGKYRAGFGRLNAVHPHAYPFVDRFRVLAAYLPGDESYNEVGGQISYRLPLPGNLSSTLSADILQGSTFHPDQSAARPALLGRWANSFMLNGTSSMEIGASLTHGTNNPALKTTTTIGGLDVKAKLWLSPLNSLVLQGEAFALDRQSATVDSLSGEIAKSHLRPAGGYLFADYTWHKRWEGGMTYERYQRLEPDKPWDQAYGAFLGFALMEETTLFRLQWNRFVPDGGDACTTYTFQLVFSMGPHKPHQF
jgi:hypothetical protein